MLGRESCPWSESLNFCRVVTWNDWVIEGCLGSRYITPPKKPHMDRIKMLGLWNVRMSDFNYGDSWWCPAVGFSWVSQPWGCTSAWSLSVIVIRARPRVPTCHGNFPEKSLLVLLRVGTLVEWRFSKDPDFLWLFLILILLMATRNPARSHQLRERYFIPVFTMYLQGAFYIPVPGGDRRISSIYSIQGWCLKKYDTFQPNQSTLLISAGRSPWNQWGGEVFFFNKRIRDPEWQNMLPHPNFLNTSLGVFVIFFRGF